MIDRLELVVVVVMLMLGTLAACDGSPTPTAAPTPTPGPTATPTATPTPEPTPTQEVVGGRSLVEVGRGRFVVEVADDAAERAQGLSGREALADGAGMWFDLGVEREARFWMQDMLISLDMVWVDASLRVVSVTADVPPPAPGTATGDLLRYGPDVPVRYVLEINAGVAGALGIEPGMQVSITGP